MASFLEVGAIHRCGNASQCIAMHHATIWHRLINADALPQDRNKIHVTGTLVHALPGLFSEWDHNKRSSNVSFG